MTEFADQHKAHERPIDRVRQEVLVKKSMKLFPKGSVSAMRPCGCRHDTEIFYNGQYIAMLEAKYREGPRSTYNHGLQIDKSKIDYLFNAPVSSYLLVSWQGDDWYVKIQDLSPMHLETVTAKRRDRDEKPDVQYQIPLDEFRRL